MKGKPANRVKTVLRNLIRDTASAVDAIEALRDQAASDGDVAAAEMLNGVRRRLTHADDELKTAEALAKSPRQPKRPSRRPQKRPVQEKAR